MVASVVVRAAEVIAKGSGVPLWHSRGAKMEKARSRKRAGDGGSGGSHAIFGEVRLAGSDQPFVTLMNELLTQRAHTVHTLCARRARARPAYIARPERTRHTHTLAHTYITSLPDVCRPHAREYMSTGM